MFLRILMGLVIVVIGFLFVKNPNIPYDFIGPSAFATRWFLGGSLFFYQLLGVVLCVVGLLVITNLYGNVINWMLNFIT